MAFPTQQKRANVIECRACLLQLLHRRQRQLMPGANQVVRPLAIEQRNEIICPIQLLGESACASVGLSHVRCRPTFRDHQRRAKRDLQIEFLLLSPGIVGQAGQQVQSLLQLRDCFSHR